MAITSPKTIDYLMLVGLAAIFGGSFMLTKVAVMDIPAATLVTIRLGLAAMMFFVVMKVKGQSMPPFGWIWVAIAGAALFGNSLPFFLISWGQERVDAGLAAILMATMPLMTIVIAHFLTQDEKLNRYKSIGFLLGLLGVAVMIGFDKLATLGEETIRQYAITGGALCYAISAIITKRLVHLPRYGLMTALMVLSTLIILPVAFVSDDLPNILAHGFPGNSAVMAAIALAILPTAIGTILVFKIVARQGASFLSQINFMVPVFGVFWSILFLSEILPQSAAIALVLILVGVAIARISPKVTPESSGVVR